VAAYIRERRKERLALPKVEYRIRRGKKDVTEYPKALPTGKSADFYDPSSSFGKRSDVYQYKTGQLDEKLARLREKKARLTGADFYQQRVSEDGMTSFRKGLEDESEKWHTPRKDTDRLAAERVMAGRRPRRDINEASPFSRSRRSIPTREESYARNNRDNSDSLATDQSSADYWGRKGFAGRRTPQGVKESSSHFNKRRMSPPEEQRPRGRISPSALKKLRFDSLELTTAASQFLYGKSVVEAALRANRRQLYNLYIYGGASRHHLMDTHNSLESLAEQIGIKITTITEQRMMDKASLGRPHNGYILEASPLPQPPVVALGQVSSDPDRQGFDIVLGHQSTEEADINGSGTFVPTALGTHKPLILLLDAVQDPGNLGNIIRSASFLGVNAVAISKSHSAALTAVTLKASAGAAETMKIFSLDNPADFLANSKEAGWKVYTAVPATSRNKHKKHMDINELEKRDPLKEHPCILVIGNEGEGLPRFLKSKADFEISIPNSSASSDIDMVDSLNVSSATAILCSSFVKQRTSFKMFPGTATEPSMW
jgi:21S rRNA (GM2251-2'-O)-methyltransferase